MKRIVLIDDDPSLCEVMQLIFPEQDYNLQVLSHIERITDQVRSCPDLFIIDRFLGRGDGLVLCRELKAHPVYCQAPVLMISGSQGIEEAAKAAGADLVLMKPFRIKLVREMVNKVLYGKYWH